MPRKLIGVLQTSGMQGPPGPEGKPGPEGVAGKGFPVGGLANQILAKKSDADYDTEWIDNNAKGNVESVNGKTGKVTLTAEDVGATTEQWVNQQNYLKSIPSEYITETELNEKGYLTEHQDISNLATKAEVPTKTSQLINDSNFLTEHQDLTGYATEGYVDNKVSEIDLSGYALKTEIPTVPTNVSAFNNDVGYLTEIPSEYVTETELESKGYLTEHQSLANYSTTEEMNNAISNHHDSTKQDKLTAGSNITIENNVISATGGGEPDAYIKSAAVNGNKLTLTNKDNTTVEFEPTGGSGGGSSYTFTNGLTETDGTVSWDLNDTIYKHSSGGILLSKKRYTTGTVTKCNFGIISCDYDNNNLNLQANNGGSLVVANINSLSDRIMSFASGTITGGYTEGANIISSGCNGSITFGIADINYGKMENRNRGSQVFG